jgi:hypothetical protein
MAVIKTFFGLILIFLFVVFGYWMYATYALRSGDNAVWDGINGMMPEVLQQWSCSEIRQRAGADPAPKPRLRRALRATKRSPRPKTDRWRRTPRRPALRAPTETGQARNAA